MRFYSLLSPKEKEQILDLLEKIIKSKHGISNTNFPISIFRSNISGLEAIVVYLKDSLNWSTKKISKTLNRKLTTIYTTYNNASKKLSGKKSLGRLDTSDHSIIIPIDVFSNRKFSVLESLVAYLIKHGFKLSQISKLLNKNYSTVKTVYRRYMIKCR